MWLFTRHGFYSVVQDKKNKQQIQVRARIKKDLDRLSQFVSKELGDKVPAVISTPAADYAYRLVIEKRLWVKLATALAADVDYTNFKNTVHGEGDRDATYLAVWSAMNQLQEKRRRGDER